MTFKQHWQRGFWILAQISICVFGAGLLGLIPAAILTLALDSINLTGGLSFNELSTGILTLFVGLLAPNLVSQIADRGDFLKAPSQKA